MRDIDQAIAGIRLEIASAAKRVGRDPGEIELVAVTKTIACPAIQQAVDAGVVQLGENRAQELLDKHPLLPAEVKWHFIGQLQTNKVKYIADKACMVQSLDRVTLADELERRCALIGRELPVLIEINIGQEAQKGGIAPADVPAFCQAVSRWPHLKVQGLMTVAPMEQDAERARPYFAQMKRLFDSLARAAYPGVDMRTLSMGMSMDYIVAVEEGSTMVRIGSLIFGHR